MHHGTCVTHVPWCMSGSLTRAGGETVTRIPGACTPTIWRIWQNTHCNDIWWRVPLCFPRQFVYAAWLVTQPIYSAIYQTNLPRIWVQQNCQDTSHEQGSFVFTISICYQKHVTLRDALKNPSFKSNLFYFVKRTQKIGVIKLPTIYSTSPDILFPATRLSVVGMT